MENIITPQQMHYGFMLRKRVILVKILGILKTYLEDIKTIVSINQILEYVKKYIKKRLV